MKTLNVLGLNSGTSMDGIDAAAFTIIPLGPAENGSAPNLQVEPLYSELIPFPSTFARRLTRLVNKGEASLQEVCLVHSALGELFADAAIRVSRQLAKKNERLDLIGSHGQTIWHEPNTRSLWGVKTRGTLQLGDGAVIAARTGVPVVYDFRTDDLAWGGQGAPLVSFADEVLFGQQGRALGVLNIGGIANLTVLDSTGKAVMAFDTGPGGMIIDRICETLFGRQFDEGGVIAKSGRVDEAWLEELLRHPYIKEQPPKTTGREAFGHRYADQLADEAIGRKIAPADIVATVTAFTAASIARSYEKFAKPETKIELIVIGGGGGENETLLAMMKSYWPHDVEIKPHESFGISKKFKEGLLFALLAYTRFFEVPNNVPRCTGARKRVSMGKLVKP